jgi:N6-adenosine-specific RNA methylase IME4
MEFHEIANIFPMLGDSELQSLADDIKANGLQQPITLYQGKILDGRNRYLACAKAGAQATFTHYQDKNPIQWVVSQNLHRRHLTESQRATAAAKIETLKRGRPGKDANLHVNVSRKQAAQMLNVSERLVASAAKIHDEGTPELIHAVETGTVKVSPAADIATLPKDEQSEVVAKGEKEILKKAAEIREKKRVEQRIINQAKAKAATPKIDGEYDVIVVDPPWPMKRIERDCTPNQVAELEYPTMELPQIRDMEIPAAADCHLWLWTTHKFLPDALRILDDWGFHYINLFTWFKTGGFQPFGLPQYNSEFAIYGRKGSPTFRDTKNFFTCFRGSRGAHSEKPTEFYETIRRVTDGRRLDMFGRRTIPGFDSWGNEAPQMGTGKEVVG